MKKDAFWMLVLTAPCILALLAVSSPRPVMVFHADDKTAHYYSSFQQVTDAPALIWLLLAGLLSEIATLFTAHFLFSRKRKSLKVVFFTACFSMTLATLPIISESTPKVLPDMVHPLVMCTVTVITYIMLAHWEKPEKDMAVPGSAER